MAFTIRIHPRRAGKIAVHFLQLRSTRSSNASNSARGNASTEFDRTLPSLFNR